MSLTSDKLTTSYKQIAAIPIQKRMELASSGLATSFANALTPSQKASLFPKYYPQVASLGNQNFSVNALPPPSQAFTSSPPTNPSPVGGGPPQTYTPGKTTSQTQVLQTVINTLMKGDPEHGLPGLPYGKARALAANFGSESNFNPTAQGDLNLGTPSVGIGQWRQDRLDALRKFATDRKADWTDPSTQALFSLHEFQTTHSKAFADFMAANNPEDEYHILRKEYEVGMEGGSNRANYDQWLKTIDEGQTATAT